MSIVITIDHPGLLVDTAEKRIQDWAKKFYPKAHISVAREVPAESRSDRFGEIKQSIEDAKSDTEELRDELQSWHDNLPENLQDGEKAEELQTAIDALEECINSLEEAAGIEVDFPSMM